MSKIVVCDICKHEGKLVETNKYMSVKGKPFLRLDYCSKCRSKIPADMTEYRKLVARVNGYPENFFVDMNKPVKLLEV